MAEIDYLVIGHVTVDRLPNGRFLLGGTATYASLTAHRLGARVALHTSAAYEPGLVELLRGIRVARIPAAYTTQFVNSYTGERRRQRIEAVAEKLTYGQLLPEWRSAPIVHLAPVAQEVDPDLATCFPNAFVGVTPQGWMRRWDAEGNVSAIPWPHAEFVLPRASAVVFSDADLPDRALLDEYVRLARTLVVTHGPGGATVYHGGEARRSPAFKPASEQDPTGAGDVFAAAYFLQYQRTGDPFAAADWANCVASFAVERPGPLAVPTLEAVEERWKRGQRIRT
jgi:sugar/nucleoside kinase (ribokinase family)